MGTLVGAEKGTLVSAEMGTLSTNFVLAKISSILGSCLYCQSPPVVIAIVKIESDRRVLIAKGRCQTFAKELLYWYNVTKQANFMPFDPTKQT